MSISNGHSPSTAGGPWRRYPQQQAGPTLLCDLLSRAATTIAHDARHSNRLAGSRLTYWEGLLCAGIITTLALPRPAPLLSTVRNRPEVLNHTKEALNLRLSGAAASCR